MAKYKVTLTQRSESTHGEHSGWRHYHVGPYTEVEAEFPFTGGVVQVGSSNGMGIGYFRSYKWTSDDSAEQARAYMFSGRGKHDNSWSSWTAPPVVRDFNLTGNSSVEYKQSSTGGYSSAGDWAAGQAAVTLVQNVRTYASPSEIAYAQGYTNHSYGAFAFIWDTVDEKFVTGQDCIDNGVTTVNGYDPITGGGNRYVLAMITSAPITTVDDTPPTISGPSFSAADVAVVGSTNYIKTSTFTVTYTATDSHADATGVREVYIDGVRVTSGNASTLTASKTYSAPGSHTTNAYALDGVGNNSGLTANFSFTFDDVPPTTTIAHSSAVTPEGGINYSNINPFVFNVTASDSESGIDYIEWSGTDGSSGQLSSDGTVELTTEGEEITISVDAYDVAGNKSTSTATETVFIDTAEPEVSLALTSPEFTVGSKSYYATTSVEIDVEYEDVAGVKQADLYLNGSPISMTAVGQGVKHTSTETLTGVEGVNMAQLHVIDNATNEIYSSEVIFYVDTTKPVCFINFSTQDTILENGGKYWTKENEIKVDLTYDDPGADPSGIYKGEIVVNGSVPTSKSGFTLSLSGTSKTGHTVSGLSVGKNDIDFCVIDNAENISVKDTITVWVDQTDTTGSMTRAEPIATLTDANEYTNTNKFDVTLTKSDSDAGLF